MGKPFQKAESRLRNRKAVEEIGKPLKKIVLDFSEMRKPLKKIELYARKIGSYERILRGKLDLTKGFRRDYLVTYHGSWIQRSRNMNLGSMFRGTWILMVARSRS
jgi:hypothetical protein